MNAGALGSRSRIFYDKLLSHPWLKDFFEGVPRPHLEYQQTGFLAAAFGGPWMYGGRPIDTAHLPMFITEEVFMLRHDILGQSLIEAGVRPDLRERWLAYSMKTERALVKASIGECAGRHKTEPIFVVAKPGARTRVREEA